MKQGAELGREERPRRGRRILWLAGFVVVVVVGVATFRVGDPPEVTIEGERPAGVQPEPPIVLEGNDMPPEGTEAAEALKEQMRRAESPVDVPPGQPMPIPPGDDP